MSYFFTCVRYRQLAADTSLAFRATRSGWWVNGRAGSFVGICSDYGCLNTEKSVPFIDSNVQTLQEGKENQNTERKTESYVFSGFGKSISRSWERKSTTGSFATGLFWPCTWKISAVGKDQVSNWEFFILKIMPIVFVVFQHIFSSWALAPTHFTIFIRGLSILIHKVDFFLSVKGYCVYMIKKIMHGCL